MTLLDDDRWTGLSSTEARERLAATGPNELQNPEQSRFLKTLVSVVREPMFLLLLGATAIYLIFGDVTEAITLGVSVLGILVITVYQHRRTERALEALRDLATPRARVRRDRTWQMIDARELVVGDLIQIAEGERIPADAVLRAGPPISVDESLLTGESVPVIREPDPEAVAGNARAGVFAGTLVGSGHGLAEVVATGPRSAIGRIGASLDAITPTRAPLEREVDHVVPRIAAVAIALACALVVIRGLSEGDWLRAALAGITLAMSLLPEELPVILTVFLAFGAWRIAKHGVLARRGAAIEALGAVTVLCVDKTGTLTQNKMTIRRLVGDGVEQEVTGAELPESVHRIVEFGALACPRLPTDPMDRAFVSLLERALGNTEHVHPRWRWVREYPLRAGLFAVTHVWDADEQRAVVATKGAPEAIIDLCHLQGDAAAMWRARVALMAEAGLRVIGVAHATFEGAAPPENPHDFAFEIVGLVGLEDPLRDDTAEMVARCHSAGMRVVMITGDHRETARAIARSAGIPASDVLTGPEVDALDDAGLASRLQRAQVIARATPDHKLRIVQALRARGEIVGMTGDGVNDAPALQAADIGIAMGGRGTDVAREASALILVEDDLGSLVKAAELGRAIYDNIRKAVAYILAVHVPIAGVALLPPLLGWGALLAPIHIVFFELVIDPACSIVFELEPADPEIMNRPPRSRGTHLFERRTVARSLGLGALALIGALAVIGAAHTTGLPLDAVRALAFVGLVAGNLALLSASREGRRGSHNRAALLLGAAVIVLGALALGIPGPRSLFLFTLPTPASLAIAIAVTTLPVLVLARVLRVAAHRRGTQVARKAT